MSNNTQPNNNKHEQENQTRIVVNHTPPAPMENFEENLRSEEYQKLDEFMRGVDPYAKECEDRVIEGYREILSDGEFRRQQATEWGKELHKEFQERDKDIFAEKEITLRTSDGKAVRPDGISLDEYGERDGCLLREIKTYIPSEEKLEVQLEKNIDASIQEYGRSPEAYQVDIYEPGNLRDVTTNMKAFLDAYENLQETEATNESEGNTESSSEFVESEYSNIQSFLDAYENLQETETTNESENNTESASESVESEYSTESENEGEGE